jgi:hypothetical protein
MSGKRNGKGVATSTLVIAGCVGLLALPSAVLAFTADFTVKDVAAPNTEKGDADGSVAVFSRTLAVRSLAKGRLFPFTPAGVANQAVRSVTVAVRVDPAAAGAITVRGRSLAQPDEDLGRLRIAPTGFSLGISRGYRNFAQDITQATPRAAAMDLPDLHKYSLAPSPKPDDGRFSPHISLDDKPATGRAPRTFAGDGSEVDLGGAYRVAKNLNVTAGVRYSQERERLTPLTDGKQDSQAVYVGTQFSF